MNGIAERLLLVNLVGRIHEKSVRVMKKNKYDRERVRMFCG